jgi:heme exporter protein D
MMNLLTFAPWIALAIAGVAIQLLWADVQLQKQKVVTEQVRYQQVEEQRLQAVEVADSNKRNVDRLLEISVEDNRRLAQVTQSLNGVNRRLDEAASDLETLKANDEESRALLDLPLPDGLRRAANRPSR